MAASSHSHCWITVLSYAHLVMAVFVLLCSILSGGLDSYYMGFIAAGCTAVYYITIYTLVRQRRKQHGPTLMDGRYQFPVSVYPIQFHKATLIAAFLLATLWLSSFTVTLVVFIVRYIRETTRKKHGAGALARVRVDEMAITETALSFIGTCIAFAVASGSALARRHVRQGWGIDKESPR